MMQDLNVTVEAARPSMSGIPEYGHAHALRSSVMETKDVDQRFLVARSGGTALGALLVTSGPTTTFSAHPVLGELCAKRDSSQITFVGNISEFFGGAVVLRSSDPRDSMHVLVSLTAAARAAAGAETLHAPNVPHTQAPAFLESGFAVDSRREPRLWHDLMLPRMGDELGFLDDMDASRRRRWRRDLHLLDELHVDALVGLTELHRDESAFRLIAAVRQRHGVATHPVLLEYELASWSQDEADGLVTLAATGPGNAVQAVCFAKIRGQSLELHYVGIIDDTRRGDLYRAVVFAAPLRFAFRHALTAIVYGSGQDAPKLLRGARSEILYTLISQQDESEPTA